MKFDPSQLPAQSVMIGLGILVACTVVYVGARRGRVALGDAFGLYGICVVFGAIGGRIGWLVLDPLVDMALLVDDPMVALDLRRGGYNSFGALIGAAVAVGLWWRSGARVGERRAMLDVMVPAGLSGLGMARLGCLFNGCDIGRPTGSGWGVRHAAEAAALADSVSVEVALAAGEPAWTVPLHPFALYMAVGTFAIVTAALVVGYRRRLPDGHLAIGAAAAYFALRFAVEFVRHPGDAPLVVGPLNVAHIVSFIGLMVLIGLASRWREADGGSPGDHSL